MAIHIENLKIDAFRGINQLNIPALNHVNIIAGDNNCGKTSILEAVLLLRDPQEFSNTIRIARLRNGITRFSSESLYQSFISLFPHRNDHYELQVSLSAEVDHREIFYKLHGIEKTVMLDPNELNRSRNSRIYRGYAEPEWPQEGQGFLGEQLCIIDHTDYREDISLNEYQGINGLNIPRVPFLNIIYLAPFDHLQGNLFNRILRNNDYKRLCIEVLQIFDSDIEDLLLIKNDLNGRPIECVRHARLGIMPLSTYGDGIKKVLSIASGIAKAANGILLIDEIETAIHAKYYTDIFSFISMASYKFNTQVMITSHSLEAIDAFLEIQNYDEPNDEDSLSIITLKKDKNSNLSYSRILSGRRVYENREQFGFEVRL